jgi:hypothetical protein
MECTSPLPPDLQAVLDKLRKQYGTPPVDVFAVDQQDE